ncbi:Holliday junction resolvase RuvX [Candidatus Epulonipiscium viviparus]|uniref:Holliday junction resolvase RuvX n=1 Tax=Candidatus Epulonipiscium viviparus TaxID=420336 RepID=UPI002738134D|nr:Holliday junction resolvase RuvX [Candidatus Epulopiscium viviparus]
MGLDFGTNTTGVAISDPFFIIANPVSIIRRKDPSNIKATINELEKICKEQEVGKIVLGLPKNMNNTSGKRVEETILFQTKLKNRLQIPVVLWDERLSTVAATNVLLEADLSRKKRSKVIDKVAAVIILQNYLDANRGKEIGKNNIL